MSKTVKFPASFLTLNEWMPASAALGKQEVEFPSISSGLNIFPLYYVFGWMRS